MGCPSGVSLVRVQNWSPHGGSPHEGRLGLGWRPLLDNYAGWVQARAVTWIRWALHALVLGLTLWSALALPHVAPASRVWAAALGLATVYAAGVVGLPELRDARAIGGHRRTLLRVWFVLVLLAWCLLLWLAPVAAYIAFPLFFLSLHLHGVRLGLVTVTLELVASIAGLSHHQGNLTWQLVLGPTIGAAVAAATVITFDALVTESNHRQRLIHELEATRADLAAAQHDAGVMTERERLSGEIHDTLAQHFQGISLLLASVERALPGDPERAARLVDQARESSLAGLTEARQLVAALAPADLMHTTLSAALERLATRSSTPDLRVTFVDRTSGRERSSEVEAVLLRVAQSAVANVTHHADAERCTLTLTDRELVVSDDGRGFDTTRSGSGYGLDLMRRRLESVGGGLVIESDEDGTTVTASLGND